MVPLIIAGAMLAKKYMDEEKRKQELTKNAARGEKFNQLMEQSDQDLAKTSSNTKKAANNISPVQATQPVADNTVAQRSKPNSNQNIKPYTVRPGIIDPWPDSAMSQNSPQNRQVPSSIGQRLMDRTRNYFAAAPAQTPMSLRGPSNQTAPTADVLQPIGGLEAASRIATPDNTPMRRPISAEDMAWAELGGMSGAARVAPAGSTMMPQLAEAPMSTPPPNQSFVPMQQQAPMVIASGPSRYPMQMAVQPGQEMQMATASPMANLQRPNPWPQYQPIQPMYSDERVKESPGDSDMLQDLHRDLKAGSATAYWALIAAANKRLRKLEKGSK